MPGNRSHQHQSFGQRSRPQQTRSLGAAKSNLAIRWPSPSNFGESRRHLFLEGPSLLFHKPSEFAGPSRTHSAKETLLSNARLFVGFSEHASQR